VFFLAITGAAQSLEIANVVATTRCEGDNMVDRQFGGLPAALTLMVVAVEYIFPHFFGKANSFGFF
jgi:hypothetical protein